MRATAKALKEFVSSFGLPAYTVDSVPDDVQVPYLTYPLSEPEWDRKSTWYIQGWFRTTSNAELTATADYPGNRNGNPALHGMRSHLHLPGNTACTVDDRRRL